MNDFLLSILSGIHSWGVNWGWSMVIFTFLIRLVLTPLDVRSRAGMRKTTKIQPKVAELQKKYANDKEKLNAKTAELYKKEGVNPMSSCLPMLLTWPILIIVFSAMRTAANREILAQLTQILNNETPTMEPWLWIKNLWMPDSFFSPAWPDLNTLRQIPADLWQNWFNNLQEMPALIKDLGLTAESFLQGDNLTKTLTALNEAMLKGNAAYANAISTNTGWSFNLLITQLNLVREYNGWMLLPILSAVTQIVMTKILGGNQQPQANDQNPMGGKFMMWFFPIFSMVICFGYSSAFALYWVSGNLISMLQTIVINKVLDAREKKNADKIEGKGKVQ